MHGRGASSGVLQADSARARGLVGGAVGSRPSATGVSANQGVTERDKNQKIQEQLASSKHILHELAAPHKWQRLGLLQERQLHLHDGPVGRPLLRVLAESYTNKCSKTLSEACDSFNDLREGLRVGLDGVGDA